MRHFIVSLLCWVTVTASAFAHSDDESNHWTIPVVTIQTMLVECSLETAREIFHDDLGAGRTYTVTRLDMQKIRELESSKKLTVTSAPQISTVSGSQAQTRSVVEFTYVYDYNVSEKGETPVTRTREIGTLLNVTAVVGTDGKTINLTVIPEYCWVIKPIRRVEYILPFSRIKTFIDCPEFVSYNLTTSVVIKSGSTVLIGGGNQSDYESKDAQAKIGLWLITATVNEAK